MKRFGRLEVIAFVTGFALMAYELAAARILAPTIGSSTYVWTSVIGVIIAALSFGYWQGGRLADARHRPLDVVVMLLITAGCVIFSLFATDTVLAWVLDVADDPRWQAVLAATVLFAPASFVLGALSPYLAKLNVRSLATAGRSIASLGALNSIGGIIGTFVTGFFLFGYVGSRETLAIVVVLLVAASWLLVPRLQWRLRVVASLVALIVFAPVHTDEIVIDTPSAHYRVIEGTIDYQPVRGLITGPRGIQSAVYLDNSDELVFWYTSEMARLTIDRQPESVLMLGGGAFTLPQYLADKLPDATIDVVEIDPELESISTQYFGYKHPDNVQLIFTDARTYVEQSNKQYDVVLVDVYGDAQIPFSLMTAEYGRAVAERVKPGGIVLVNLIAGLTQGPCQELFAAFDATYRQYLPHGYYTNQANQRVERANHVVLYASRAIEAPGLRPLEALGGQLYRDNFAPSERLYHNCEQRYM